MSPPCRKLVIAGAASGVGKTSLALGLTGALIRRGLTVQTFKVGPDFLDPTYLALASGRTCYNLDGWMTGRDYVCDLFARATAGADIAIVEGVMGLFDGASPATLEGSTAEIACWLDAPVLLVANARGVARSFAAMVKGFAQFEGDVRVAGVIANQAGGQRHAAWLAESLAAAGGPLLIGAVPRGALAELASRHLGLVTADAASLSAETIGQLADACEKHLDIERILATARGAKPGAASGAERRVGSAGPVTSGQTSGAGFPASARSAVAACPHAGVSASARSPRVRIGVARDAAFHFYYPDNLAALAEAGAGLVPFSPLADAALPAGLAGLYLGGGYPEVFAERLAGNESMRRQIRSFAESGRCVYAECGGLIYLGRSVRATDGRRWPMAGVLPIDAAMLARLKTLGYVQAQLQAGSLWGGPGGVLRGHEFHYSQITADDAAAGGWRPAYLLRRPRVAGEQPEGFRKGGVLASYVHLHFASHPEAAGYFVSRCEANA